MLSISLRFPEHNLKSDILAGPIDPSGLPLEDILLSLQQAVAECLDSEAAECSHADDSSSMSDSRLLHRSKQDPSLLSLDKSLIALGMDSMRGIQLQAVLEARFSDNDDDTNTDTDTDNDIDDDIDTDTDNDDDIDDDIDIHVDNRSNDDNDNDNDHIHDNNSY